MVTFVLYLVWDVVGYRIARSPKYALSDTLDEDWRRRHREDSRRRMVTLVCLLISFLTWLSVWLARPGTATSVLVVDVMLIVGFRFAKDYIPKGVLEEGGRSSSSRAF